MIFNDRAFKSFKKWTTDYIKTRHTSIKLRYDPDMKIVTGMTDNKDNSYEIILGIADSSIKNIGTFGWMKEQDFVKLGVTLFHELAHCDQHIQDTSKEILLSDLSKYKNADYYINNWHIMQHEIDAEYKGIMLMWEKLDETYPDKSDKLMFDYLRYREYDEENGKKIYIIKEPDEDYQSREQVQELFEQAYEDAAAQPKRFGIMALAAQRDRNEIARLFLTENRVPIPEYTRFSNMIETAHNGHESDVMMASIISYIHPELQDDYPGLDFKELEPYKIFGIQMSETIGEARERLGYDDFTAGVERITMQQDSLKL